MLALEHLGGGPERRSEAVRRELRILGENLFLRCPARSELEPFSHVGRRVPSSNTILARQEGMSGLAFLPDPSAGLRIAWFLVAECRLD